VEVDCTRHYVIAGSVRVEDDGSYFDPSQLLPEEEVNLKLE
jgi:hypothetical protein